jgi:hypothetical protein
LVYVNVNALGSTFGPDNLFRRLPEDVVKRMMSHEHFALSWPNLEPGLQLTDLFAGL